ncbi:MAG: hypothetical protein LBG89_02705 [Rickettsiales bacterium]|jgi:ATP-dependent helicase/nuclease subunit A|nr:hypothetical protein [Rickettsiales bacterium]
MTYKSVKEFLEKMKEQDAAVQAGIDFHKLAEKNKLPPEVFAAAPELAEFFGPGSRAEVPVAGMIDGRVQARRIDRMALSADAVKFIDFKTGGGDAADYRKQMAEYGRLLGEIYPGKKITGFIFWTGKSVLQQVFPVL